MRIILVNESSTVMLNIFTGNDRLVELLRAEENNARMEAATRESPGHTWGPPEKVGMHVDR